MPLLEHSSVESYALSDFARIMPGPGKGLPSSRIEVQENKAANGLGQLVLTLVKLLHELLERQAIQRMEAGSLTEAQIERLGTTLMRQTEEIDRLRQAFGLQEEDLNLDLGPLGRLM